MNILLTFAALRAANTIRLPQFKNKHGEAAHSKVDGSDWSPAQWLGALFGEIGEFARVRVLYDQGRIDFETYKTLAAKELADIQTYLDILARRSLDTLEPGDRNGRAQVLMRLLASVGEYANEAKKFDRGDISDTEFDHLRDDALVGTHGLLEELAIASNDDPSDEAVAKAHILGVDLAQATEDKFNEVSERVGSSVRLVNGKCVP